MNDALTAETVMFQGAALLTVQIDETVYVAMKPIVKALGIKWARQVQRIRDEQRYAHMYIPLQTPGGMSAYVDSKETTMVLKASDVSTHRPDAQVRPSPTYDAVAFEAETTCRNRFGPHSPGGLNC
ncbi:phage antirepressor N-terminal domain-containing protein [Chitinimonas koreensis]|uniref:phage antirepressor N-terminal domain-containing protein n=1 Tax=Chitinimonas koreensis TaxID=356302 RepID=UPI000A0285E7|nr:phage antirepressor N-terminal domain-containing protein [Chitinimonas koreensis]QNM95469.1 hypothetical protein H9L41_16575 [Chitinimonas koreensis]